MSSSLDSLLKLSKMTSPQKLFDYDCITLYLHPKVWHFRSRTPFMMSSGSPHRMAIQKELFGHSDDDDGDENNYSGDDDTGDNDNDNDDFRVINMIMMLLIIIIIV